MRVLVKRTHVRALVGGGERGDKSHVGISGVTLHSHVHRKYYKGLSRYPGLRPRQSERG